MYDYDVHIAPSVNGYWAGAYNLLVDSSTHTGFWHSNPFSVATFVLDLGGDFTLSLVRLLNGHMGSSEHGGTKDFRFVTLILTSKAIDISASTHHINSIEVGTPGTPTDVASTQASNGTTHAQSQDPAAANDGSSSTCYRGDPDAHGASWWVDLGAAYDITQVCCSSSHEQK